MVRGRAIAYAHAKLWTYFSVNFLSGFTDYTGNSCCNRD